MTDNVVFLDEYTDQDIPADRVLENNVGRFDKVMLLGYDKDGEMRFCSSFADPKDMIWLLTCIERAIMDAGQ